MRYEFEVDNDHFQLLLGDSEHGTGVDTTHLWDSDNRVAMLPDERHLVGLGTVRYGGRTRVLVEIAEEPPGPERQWEEKGEFSLDIPSGKLGIWGPEAEALEEAATVSVLPGRYAGIAFVQRADAVEDEMAADGPDVYRVVLWRS
jgi:hypothetical protein